MEFLTRIASIMNPLSFIHIQLIVSLFILIDMNCCFRRYNIPLSVNIYQEYV